MECKLKGKLGASSNKVKLKKLSRNVECLNSFFPVLAVTACVGTMFEFTACTGPKGAIESSSLPECPILTSPDTVHNASHAIEKLIPEKARKRALLQIVVAHH